MQYDIDSVTIHQAAVDTFGADVQISHILWLDSVGEYISVNITPANNRSFRGRFYYRKKSFNEHAQNID